MAAKTESTLDALGGFSPATRAWFEGAFAEPTQAQAQAWRAIGRGDDALVIAPTGSGKTLSAFLWAIDKLASEPPPADPKKRCRVLYVSPLKALAVDIERNLRSPLTGIRHAAHRLGLPDPEIGVAVRTGDTAAEERRRLATKPPDILITTPESLFLLLTSQARETLRGVETVIVDEVHAVAGTKRGAHLALSLERLDALRGRGDDARRPAQRVGLSATVRPPEVVATFLGGARPVTVVQPPSAKQIDLEVIVPVEDMSDLETATAPAPAGPAATGPDGEPGQDPVARRSIWPHVEERVLDLIEQHKSTIVFANSRRLAERLCGRLNELAGERAALAGYEGPGPVIARAHHGSVSRQERSDIEEALKAGHLPAVVATSSLELGIDMGAVDLVIQVESPPSVASGLQRVGRAGHNVGDVSRGIFFPKYAGDLVSATVVATRMRDGEIEELRVPRNPLDVLAQQVVAMAALDEWPVDELEQVVRRAAPFAQLTRPVLESVLDMLAGRYPGEEFAGLKPRVVWDRVAGVIRGRPGAQRLAVTSGGTIPDRGLFGVFLPAAEGGRAPRRVGELDEEMVYESRVGDVFVLGASSWRIEDITPDRVLVLPAPGQPGKLPFWHGDTAGRPAELGKAIGSTVRQLGRLGDEQAVARLRTAGLDELAAGNLMRYLADQRAATGHVPDDRTLVVERFRDELGDWRVVLHSPYGDRVHAPWALAIAARLRERYGAMDVQALHTDDGIIIRVPDSDEPPPAGIALIAPDEVADIVTAEVGGSALFASRFRECAARALLLPRRQPGRRTPLWQQRQRSAQLLEIAAQFPGFPIVLETVRECLQDVFDVPALMALLTDLAARRVRVVEVETPLPSPFAKSLLFRYVGAFMYEGDAPLAERRAQALALDPSLLAELLGTEGLRELLDPAVVAETEADLQHLSPGRRCRDAEAVFDLLRTSGPLTAAEVASRVVSPPEAAGWLAGLAAARRVIEVRVAGRPMWAAIEDAGRLRDALGVALPVGVPEAFTTPLPDPLGDLVVRWGRAHGPFRGAMIAHRYGLGVAVVTMTLRRLAAEGRIVEGEFTVDAPRPEDGDGAGSAADWAGSQWCDAEVLRLLRRRCLARLRKEVEPVPAAALGRFLPAWHGIEPFEPPAAPAGSRGKAGPGGGGARRRRYGDAGAVIEVIERLAGAPVPASALETMVLPGRVPGYSPALLDELTSAGEVVWAGAGSVGTGDGWLVLSPADTAPLLLPEPGELTMTPLHDAVLAVLDGGGALFFRALSDRAARLDGGHPPDDAELAAALWDLVWAGLVSNDTLAPLRVLLGGGGQPRRSGAGRPAAASGSPGADPGYGTSVGYGTGSRLTNGSGGARRGAGDVFSPRPARRGYGRGGYGGGSPAGARRPAMPSRTGPPSVTGRWSLLPGRAGLPARPSAPGPLTPVRPRGPAALGQQATPGPGPEPAGRTTVEALLHEATLAEAGPGVPELADGGEAGHDANAGPPDDGVPPRDAPGRAAPGPDWRTTVEALLDEAVSADVVPGGHGLPAGEKGPPDDGSPPPSGASRYDQAEPEAGAAAGWLAPGAEPLEDTALAQGPAGGAARTGSGSPARAATIRAHAVAQALLERHGIVTRGAVAAERIPGGFAAVYPVLRAMEDTGQCRRGYFIEGLGAAQFALPGAVDRLRALAGDLIAPEAIAPAPPDPSEWENPWEQRAAPPAPSVTPFVLAAADPAQPYGAALPWPGRPGDTATGHKPGRKAGALVILAKGELALYVERGGKSLLSWTDDPLLLEPCAAALATAVREGALGRITVERADGETVHDTPLARALQSAGFRPTPRGLRLRG
ncbi:MAG TPA: DEAD/DEAH box helicase [Trebonia sp.]|nr:DEAD/DEAH box helicase [Trebonia sp.]